MYALTEKVPKTEQKILQLNEGIPGTNVTKEKKKKKEWNALWKCNFFYPKTVIDFNSGSCNFPFINALLCHVQSGN